MTVSQWIRALPVYIQVAVSMLVALALVGGGLAVSSSIHPRQQARGPAPSPSASLSPSPSPSESPSPSPSPSPVPSPSVAQAPAPPPPRPPAAPSCANRSGGFPRSPLAANYPVALAWSPDGRLFWAERAGAVKVFEGGAVHTFAGVATVTTEANGSYSERGLLGLAISGRYVFAMYSNTDYRTQTIIRWTDCGGAAQSPTVIAAGLPAGNDCCHKGGRLAVSPDGHLFATIGDNHYAPAAQNWGDLRGKVVRFNLDGGGRMVWTAGLRNPFGIAFAPDGTMGLTNNGPSSEAGTPCSGCGDEFYIVGKNPGVLYQWATCWGYSNRIAPPVACSGAEPDYSTERTGFFVAPTGVTWSTGAYAGHFLFCAWSTHHMYEFVAHHMVSDTGVTGCELDVKQGPDAALYTSDAGAIYRH